MKLNKEEKMTQ